VRLRAASVVLVVASVLWGAIGCEDLDEFRTPPGKMFAGTVVGGGAMDPDAGIEGSFIRRGFPVGTQLLMTFDPTPPAPPPGMLPQIGTITTTDPDPMDSSIGRTFDSTPLERIAPLQHDLLSEYDFPGGGRLRNYIFVAHGAAGGCLGVREAMVFVSLLDEGNIEVRVVAGSGGDFFEGCNSVTTPGNPGRNNVDYYGLFTLSP